MPCWDKNAHKQSFGAQTWLLHWEMCMTSPSTSGTKCHIGKFSWHQLQQQNIHWWSPKHCFCTVKLKHYKFNQQHLSWNKVVQVFCAHLWLVCQSTWENELSDCTSKCHSCWVFSINCIGRIDGSKMQKEQVRMKTSENQKEKARLIENNWDSKRNLACETCTSGNLD